MTFLPMLPWPLLLVLGLAALAAVWWNPTSRTTPGESRASHLRLTAAVLLLTAAALRPGVPGELADATAANLDVYYVVDTTSSIVAEDYGNSRPRLDGVRSDIAAIAEALPGARYSVVTFDQAARVRLPLTSDTTALGTALETLVPEAPEVSRGSSVTEANDRLTTLLEQADARHPERGRLVFYLGDGEQTAEGRPAPFTVPRKLINGGAVLGYGTTQGGRMQSVHARYDPSPTYIKDPATGEDARSVISEATLRSIAGQLGVPYLHREAGDSIEPVVAPIDLDEFGTSPEIEAQKALSRRELYWPLLLGVAALAVWEVGAAGAGLAQTRSRREPTS
ncbi:von Willebrand factor A [Intrasporangium oryzae NRRL B-24470]|uniref:von Willebrand factor A n=1 Tax=Intrasporangium oryzae NRRL B-24470 TaxID=1386089 RepID=W9G9E0_9MICO|nr:VWA domain-containing protein [Intrasporangium oryzae]EWT01862.1 von Willebrand factor A [Intrasporangium oryzae NRRL B-24470]